MFRKLTKKIRYFFSKDSCYDNMALQGKASDGKCKGVAGGTWATGFLSESCVDCPYMVWGE